MRPPLRGRAPQGARGLKSLQERGDAYDYICRAPQGARGLKCVLQRQPAHAVGRAPQGARGLNYHARAGDGDRLLVAPRKGRVD